MIQLPYGKEFLELEIPEQHACTLLTSHVSGYNPQKTQQQLVEDALEHPIGSPKLRELSRGRRRITILASDHTRPVPSRLLMPALMREIRRGNPEAEITILIATGCHRASTQDELAEKLGSDLVQREHIVVHDCDDQENMRLLGKLPSGAACWISRWACEADLLVAEGFIEPHFFAGYSGGRKAVLPGVAARETVLGNHCAEFIDHPRAKAGCLQGNPIHEDMVWAARQAGLAFILNVVLNERQEVIHAVAGAQQPAHEAGCRFMEGLCRVEAAPADLVITTNGGYPLDQNIYQAVKSMSAAEVAVKKNGVIIVAARSADGHGGEAFCRELAADDDMELLYRKIMERRREETQPDQWQVQIMARVLRKARVIYVSTAPDDLVRSLHMIPAHSLQQALTLAEDLLQSPHALVTVIPDGVSVIVQEKCGE